MIKLAIFVLDVLYSDGYCQENPIRSLLRWFEAESWEVFFVGLLMET